MDTLMLALQGTYKVTYDIVWAWIGFGFFVVGLVGFSLMGTRASARSTGHFVTKIFVVLVAMASYLALALDQGTRISGQTVPFAYARFVDWSITTPLLLLGLALLALPKAREALPLVLGLMATDAYMIVTGIFAGLSGQSSNAWWPWFIVSSVAQVVIYALLWGPLAKKAKDQAQEGRELLKSQNPDDRYTGAMHVGESGWYVAMALFLSIVWLAYPVNFFLSEQGIGVWGMHTSSTIYTVADIIAKPIYGFVLLGGVLAIERRAKKQMDLPPESNMTESERARNEAQEARREAEIARAEAGGNGRGQDGAEVRRTYEER